MNSVYLLELQQLEPVVLFINGVEWEGWKAGFAVKTILTSWIVHYSLFAQKVILENTSNKKQQQITIVCDVISTADKRWLYNDTEAKAHLVPFFLSWNVGLW